MEKIDNHGFILVETIVVAVFVIGICTFLFTNFLPLIGDYERIESYDDVQSKYQANEIRKMILREIDHDTEKQSVFTSHISLTSGYHRYKKHEITNSEDSSEKHELCDQLTDQNYCNRLLSSDYLDVEEIIVVPFKLTSFKNTVAEEEEFSRALKEYVDYLPSYYKYSARYDSYYRIIVVFNDGRMANIEVHYEIG